MTSAALLEQYRPALTGHCYRMLGSVLDAEDAVQEAMLRAWKGLDRFKEQASLKTWLYRIATNVCLDSLSATSRRRVRPVDVSDRPAVVNDDLVLTTRAAEEWVEPIPDAEALPDPDTCCPEEYVVLRESIRLAFRGGAAAPPASTTRRAPRDASARMVGSGDRREPRHDGGLGE
jgi:RNA polymerase sigma-70 factor (ECF subfamily)